MPQPNLGHAVHYRAADANTGTHPSDPDHDGNVSRCQAAIVIGHRADDTITLMVAGNHGWERHDIVHPNTATTFPFDNGRWHGEADHWVP